MHTAHAFEPNSCFNFRTIPIGSSVSAEDITSGLWPCAVCVRQQHGIPRVDPGP